MSREFRYKKLKMTLIGAVGSGKTTLTMGLLGSEHLYDVENGHTRGFDIHTCPWEPDSDDPLEVVMWDFAGSADDFSTFQVSAGICGDRDGKYGGKC